jgi:hypothetical protein
MRSDRLPYYLRRLKILRFGEPFQRFSTLMRHAREVRMYKRDPEGASPARMYAERNMWFMGDSSGGLGLAASEALEKSLPPGWWQDASFWDSFRRLYSRKAEECLRKADLVVSGKFKLFQWKEIDKPESWSSTLDPSSPGETWPLAHYAQVAFFHDGSRPNRDVKWCWELNRFQHLLWLGAAWNLSREELYARTARDHLESWIDEVPYPLGVQWSSNLEVALRLLSWIRCHILCRESISWDEEFMARFIPSLYVHGRHLGKELSVHHAVSNHQLGEACALVTLGTFYSQFKGSDRWCARGMTLLERLVPRLIHRDGVYAEQSTGYLKFVSEFLLPLIHLGKSVHAVSLPDIISRRLGDALRFLQALTPDPSEVPMIGDADSGLGVGWRLCDYWDFRPLLAAGAVLLKQSDLAEGIDEFPAESYLMLGDPGNRAFDELRGTRSTEESAAGRDRFTEFPIGGYRIIRDASFHLSFDMGPLGIYPGFGHGHADGLSFVLSFNSVPIFVDPGTFHYNGDPLWRDYFRSTRAHNTVSIDRMSQSRPIDTFLWDRPLRIRPSRLRTGRSWTVLGGSIRWPHATHERVVIHLFEGGIVVLDHIVGRGVHRVGWHGHVSPVCSLRRVSDSQFELTCGEGELDLLLLGSGRAETVVVQGSTDPLGGWYSRLYGLKGPIPTLRSTVETALPCRFLMAVKPKGRDLVIPADLTDSPLPEQVREQLMAEPFVSFAAGAV